MSEKIRTSILIVFGVLSLISVFQLNLTEKGLHTEYETFKSSPIEITKPLDQDKGLVFIAHGFAGSSVLMKPIAIALAKSGYTTIRYDFRGHGQHSLPYSGDVTTISGATKLFLDDSDAIIRHYLEKSSHSNAIVIGHSMASDIIFRAAKQNESIFGAIGISSYTDVITTDGPRNILILNGEWEKRLREKGIKTLEEIGVDHPKENKTFGSFEFGDAIKTSVIKHVGHFGILYSPKTQSEIISWVDKVHGETTSITPNYIGFWLIILCGSIFLFSCLFVQTLKSRKSQTFPIDFWTLLLGNFIAATITPIVIHYFSIKFLPFPAHNYLINHLFLYSLIIIAFLPLKKVQKIWTSWYLYVVSAISTFYLFFVGGIIDTYISTFFLTYPRLGLFLLLCVGCIPVMLILQFVYQAEKGRNLIGTMTKTFILISFVIAIWLNFTQLFLLAYAIFLFLCFFLVFGFLSNLLGRRIGAFLPIGFSNGITLAWTLATALPLYIP